MHYLEGGDALINAARGHDMAGYRKILVFDSSLITGTTPPDNITANKRNILKLKIVRCSLVITSP
jgi:hypothetical protein